MRITPENETLEAIAKLEKKIDALSGDLAAIRRHFAWEKIWGTVKLFLIVLPLAWGALTIYPVVRKLYVETQSVLQQVERVVPGR